jgi:ParB/Sulfiredoxin domain
MSITDNVLQTQQEQREVACVIVLNPADIIVGDRLRALDRESVERLKESISKIGLKTPISVRSSEQGWTLVSGRHRLEVCIELGMDEIPVVAETGSELEARLWEIAENLHRAELTALERAEHISLWIRLRVERGEGRPCGQAGDKLGQVGSVSELDKAAQAARSPARGGRGREGGVRAAARELGISRTDARRAVHRVHRIASAVREALRDMPEIADNGLSSMRSPLYRQSSNPPRLPQSRTVVRRTCASQPRRLPSQPGVPPIMPTGCSTLCWNRSDGSARRTGKGCGTPLPISGTRKSAERSSAVFPSALGPPRTRWPSP